MQPAKERPLTITVSAIMHFISGLIFSFYGGLVIIYAKIIAYAFPLMFSSVSEVSALGALVIALGVVRFLLGLGLLKLKKVAFIVALVLAGILVAFYVFVMLSGFKLLSIFGVFFNVLILILLCIGRNAFR